MTDAAVTETLSQAVTRQAREIERLHEELLARNNALRAKAQEMERLRGLIDGLKTSHLGYQEFAESEFVKLRGLLRERVDGPPVDADTTHANVLAWDADWLWRAKEALGDD